MSFFIRLDFPNAKQRLFVLNIFLAVLFTKMTHSNWTNREQKEVLVKLMEENPEIAKGFSTNRIDAERFWKNAAEKLNSYGPPTKDGATWKKVWADFKSKTKKKLVENEMKRKQSGFNDNNLVTLSQVEQAIDRIASLSQSVTGVRARVFGMIGDARSETAETPRPSASTSAAFRDVSMASLPEELMDDLDEASEGQEEEPSVPSRRRTRKDTPVQILQRQNVAQEVFFAAMSSKLDDIKNELHRINRSLQKADDRKKKSDEEKRRHNLAVESIMRDKLTLKRSMLEIQIKEIEAKLGAD